MRVATLFVLLFTPFVNVYAQGRNITVDERKALIAEMKNCWTQMRVEERDKSVKNTEGSLDVKFNGVMSKLARLDIEGTAKSDFIDTVRTEFTPLIDAEVQKMMLKYCFEAAFAAFGNSPAQSTPNQAQDPKSTSRKTNTPSSIKQAKGAALKPSSIKKVETSKEMKEMEELEDALKSDSSPRRISAVLAALENKNSRVRNAMTYTILATRDPVLTRMVLTELLRLRQKSYVPLQVREEGTGKLPFCLKGSKFLIENVDENNNGVLVYLMPSDPPVGSVYPPGSGTITSTGLTFNAVVKCYQEGQDKVTFTDVVTFTFEFDDSLNLVGTAEAKSGLNTKVSLSIF